MSSRYVSLISCVLPIAFLTSRPSFGDVAVEHSELGLSLLLPDSFERVTEEERPNDFVRVYRQSDAEGPLAIVVAIERLHRVLPRSKINEATANAHVQMSNERWGQFDISVFRVSDVINDVPAVVLNAQVPLKPEAVQLKLIGPSSQEQQLKELLRDTLATLQGSTNWLTTEQRTDRVQEGTRRLGITVAVLAMLAALLIVGVRKIWRRARTS